MNKTETTETESELSKFPLSLEYPNLRRKLVAHDNPFKERFNWIAEYFSYLVGVVLA